MCPRNEVLHAFATWARTIGGSTAAALRRLMSQAIEGTERGEGLHGARPIPVTIAPREVNRDEQVGMHLKASERGALVAAAQA